MERAGNGVPVVAIAAPNGAGLSHNRYDRFDIERQGLILNNSGAISATQLAGYIAGNPHLSGEAAARLILNEETGAQRSQLQGALEVDSPFPPLPRKLSHRKEETWPACAPVAKEDSRDEEVRFYRRADCLCAEAG